MLSGKYQNSLVWAAGLRGPTLTVPTYCTNLPLQSKTAAVAAAACIVSHSHKLASHRSCSGACRIEGLESSRYQHQLECSAGRGALHATPASTLANHSSAFCLPAAGDTRGCTHAVARRGSSAGCECRSITVAVRLTVSHMWLNVHLILRLNAGTFQMHRTPSSKSLAGAPSRQASRLGLDRFSRQRWRLAGPAKRSSPSRRRRPLQ